MKPYGSVWRDRSDDEVVMALGVAAEPDDDGDYEYVVLLDSKWEGTEGPLSDRCFDDGEWVEVR